MTAYITAYPYALQNGTLVIPDGTTDPQAYIAEHWDDIKFEEVSLDYNGTDFDFEVEKNCIYDTERISDQEFNLLGTWTHRTKLDAVIDIVNGNIGDYFHDFETDRDLPLSEGFKILAAAKAYPFEHEGFSKQDAEILSALFERYGCAEE